MRKDLKMRRGKEIVQGSHASCMFLAEMAASRCTGNLSDDFLPSHMQKSLTSAELHWIKEKFTKICVAVNSEAELEEIHKKALEAGLQSKLVTDSGKTEFHGVATKTCLAIGPDYSSKINKITGHLSLY